MRHLELVDGTSNKFWEIDYTDGDGEFTVTWGRTGTAGQTQTKEFATSDKAATEYTKLVAEKTKKGYAELGATASTPSATKPTPLAATSTQATAVSDASVSDASSVTSVPPDNVNDQTRKRVPIPK
jgi:predicted DNA-binding WGR domain protein